MAQDVISTLFGITPRNAAFDQYMQERMIDVNKAGAQYADLGRANIERASAMMQNAGTGLGIGIGRLLGGMTPQMAEEQRVQGLLGGASLQDPEQLMMASERFAQVGDIPRAQALQQQAQTLQTARDAKAAEEAKAQAEQAAYQNRLRALKSRFPDLPDVEATALAADEAAFRKLFEEQQAKVSAFGQQLIDAGFKPGTPEYQAKMNKFIDKELAPKQSLASQIAEGLSPWFKKESESYGKYLTDSFQEISTSARNASRILPSIETNLNILNKGFETGFGTETKAAAASVLSALGVQGAADYASNSQMFNAAASGAILQKQLEQKGPQTEADAQRIQQTSAQLGNTTAANKFILKVAKAQAKRDIEQRTFYQNWRKNSPNKSFEGAEDAWYAGEGGRSLFDRPELKEYRFGSNAGGSGVPGNAPAAPSQRTVVRTGKVNGRKVYQYSDGSLDYAD